MRVSPPLYYKLSTRTPHPPSPGGDSSSLFLHSTQAHNHYFIHEFLCCREEPFDHSLEPYAIKHVKASGSVSHFVDEHGAYMVTLLNHPFTLFSRVLSDIVI